MIQPVLPLHECTAESIADLATSEFVTNPTAAESGTDPAIAEFAAEPLHSVVDHAAAGAASIETSYLCV
jgi:hypothetical protein